MMYQEQEGIQISNLYNFKIINKTNEEMHLNLRVEEGKGEVKMVGGEKMVILPAQGVAEGALFILLDKAELEGVSQDVEIGIYRGEQRMGTVETKFLGPAG